MQTFNLKVPSRTDGSAGRKGPAGLYRVLRTTLIDYHRREATRRRTHDGLAREPQAAEGEPATAPCGCEVGVDKIGRKDRLPRAFPEVQRAITPAAQPTH